MTLLILKFELDYQQHCELLGYVGALKCHVCNRESDNNCYYPHPLDSSELICLDCFVRLYVDTEKGTDNSEVFGGDDDK